VEEEVKLPTWLVDFKKRIALIEVIELAFKNKCDCEVCKKLREIAEDLGKTFSLPKTP